MGKYEKSKRNRAILKKLTWFFSALLALMLLLCVILELRSGEESPFPTSPSSPNAETTNTGTVEASQASEITETPPSTTSPADTTGETSQPTEEPLATTPETDPSLTEIQLPYVLEEGLTILGISKYAGIYMEDGSDEVVSNILMIQLENTSGQDLYLAQINLVFGDQTAVFQVTNLPDGETAVLLEQQRMAYTSQLPQSASAENVSFTTAFSMCADRVEVTALNGVINVRNISGEDIPDDIYVYYKNYAGGLYYGGITYRVRVEGGLKAGEIRQLMAARFHQDGSQLLMVTIGG